MNNNEIPSVSVSSADTLANNTEPVLVVLHISRTEIEVCNIASVLERLMVLTDSPENVMLYRENLTFVVTGYETDARELPAIPEVRAFFKRLVAEWPHWLWFLARGTGAIPLLLSCLCDVVIHRGSESGLFTTEFTDPEQVQRVLFDLISRGNALFSAMNLSLDLADESVDSALSEIVGALE